VTAPRIRCALCPESFRTTVALRFHVRTDHPSPEAAAMTREAVRSERQREGRDRARAAEAAARTALDSLYRAGCPCGHSFAWHERQRAALGAWT
jgi:hypothetical protein